MRHENDVTSEFKCKFYKHLGSPYLAMIAKFDEIAKIGGCTRLMYVYPFLGMEAKNYKLGIFCQQCHPSMVPDDADIRPRNASQIHTCHLLFIILSRSPLWRTGETYPSTQTYKILFWIVMPNFGKSCWSPVTALPQKTKLSWILKQIF